MANFLDLPLNLRQEIYRHALVKWRILVGPIITSRYINHPDRLQLHSGPNLALFRTCKQIHAEAMPIYLAENIFSITQVDALASARLLFPRVYANLQQIRHVELVFDVEDYTNLTQFITSEMPRITAEIETTATKSRVKKRSLRAYQELHDRFVLPSPTTSDLTRADERKMHERHIANLREFLWGRTVTFVKQVFRLDQLIVDFEGASCPRGCCRFAQEVLRWGWCFVWLQGVPLGMHVEGVSDDEGDDIMRTLQGKVEKRGLSKRVYDAGRVVDEKANKKREGLLREVYGEIIGNKMVRQCERGHCCMSMSCH